MSYYGFNIISNSVNELVKRGVLDILKDGTNVNAKAGTGLQLYSVNFILENSRNRVHNIRGVKSIKYLAREFLAYFNGSLYIKDGLSYASKFWERLADKSGKINSNYGYYIFYEPVNELYKNQYDWIINCFKLNKETRRAIININQPLHKTNTKDFPCTISLQYFIRDNKLCSVVSSRNTDIITGLPYDMGFFSFMTELFYIDLKTNLFPELKLGYTMMRTSFVQFYYNKSTDIDLIINSTVYNEVKMPKIDNIDDLKKDIYNEKSELTNFKKWLIKMAN